MTGMNLRRCRITLIFSVMPFLTAGCGRPRKLPSSSAPPSFSFRDDPHHQAEVLQWDDGDCRDGKAPGIALTSFTSTDWSSPSPEDLTIDGIDFVDTNGLLNTTKIGATAVSLGETYSRVCEVSEQQSTDCSQNGAVVGWTFASEGITPRFCKTQGHYGRQSTERVILSTTNFFRQASNFLKSLRSLEIPLSVELKILPIFESLWSPLPGETMGRRTIRTDNVSYFAKASSMKPAFIAVLPRSEGSGENTPRLWESRFVLAHELAHHVEEQLGLAHFNSARTLVRMAVSEAFADLIGFASEQLHDDNLQHMPCLSDRAPTLDSFTNGSLKSISGPLLNALQRDSTGINSLKIYTPDYNPDFALEATCFPASPLTTHGLGAILAHAFYDLTAKALATASIQPEERPRVFAELTLNWLRATEGGIGAGRPSVVGELQIVAKAIEDVETQFFTTRNLLISEPVAKLFCQRLTQHFAGLTKSDWFHRGEACSSP